MGQGIVGLDGTHFQIFFVSMLGVGEPDALYLSLWEVVISVGLGSLSGGEESFIFILTAIRYELLVVFIIFLKIQLH